MAFHERDETRLCQLQIDRTLDANKHFGRRTPDGRTPIVLVPQRGCMSLVMSIPEGSYSLITKFGEFVGIYEPGLYWRPSWYAVSYLVTQQHIPFHVHVKECPTLDNVQIRVYLDLLFHITDPVEFVYKIGPEKLESLLKASQSEVVRRLVRNTEVSRAYNLRGADTHDMLLSLNNILNQFGVNVSQVNITNVMIPDDMQRTLQHETTFQSLQSEQRKRQEFDLKVLNDNNYLQHVEQDRQNERLRVDEVAKRQRAAVERETQNLKAVMAKKIAEVVSEQQAEVLRLQSECELQVGKIAAQMQQEVAEIKAKGEAMVQKIKAEEEKYVISVKSAAAAQAAQNRASALEVEAQAQSLAATKLRAKREYQVAQQRLNMLTSLANNKNSLVTSQSDNLVAQIVTAQSTLNNIGKLVGN